jgi:predicted phosphodiesterase
MVLIGGLGGARAYAAPGISFVEPPTPADGAAVVGSSVEIEVEIVEPALSSVTFNWNGTDYTIYDDSVVLMFNCDNVAALLENYGTPGGLVRDVSNWLNNGSVGIGNDPTTVPEWLEVGRYGGAFDFAGDGSTFGQSILVIPHDESLNPGSGNFAIAVWVRPRSDIDGDILRKGSTYTAPPTNTWYKLEHSPTTSSNKFSLNFNTDGTDATVTSPQAYNDDQWHFVLAQRRGNTAELWIDGSLQGSAAVSGSISNTANLTVGSKDDQADDFINATLDEVRLYMRSFTSDQIQMLCHSNLSKADQSTWYLYVNPSNLTGGTYTYQVSATNTSSQMSTAGPRSVTMDAPPIQAVIIKGPYLQQVTSDSIVVMWETDVAADSRVDFDGTFVEDATPVAIHEVQLTGLAADTTYGYTVTSGATISPASTFATTPAPDRSFRFVAYGDTRSQPVEHSAVVQAIINSAPEIVVHTGDLVTDGTSYSLWQTEFFDPAYGLMINTPLLPVLGNHENNASWFYNLFSLPNNEQWYAFTYGNVRFIGLNTCTAYTTGSSQYNWLVSEQQSTEYSNATWHVVYFHHPPYTATSSHGDDANVKQYLVPLFEQNGVDIVFNGHSHAYERYFNNGIYYIVTGGGGAPLASLVPDTQEPIRQAGESVYHHCTIDVDVPGQSLTMSARYNSGTAFDTIMLTKTAKATNPTPADGATGVAINADLSWKAGIGAVSHDVYFGTNGGALPLVSAAQSTSTYDPGTMDYGTTYYWRIDELDGLNIHTGDLWSFTTEVLVPELPWSDDLESGGFTAGGWTTSGNVSVSSKAVYSGIYGAEIKGTAWIEKAIDTTGFTDIHVRYWCKTNGLDSGEYLYVEWYDGSAWNRLEATQGTSWASQDMLCGAGANDNPAFKLRFMTNASNSAEYAYVDDVEITGTVSGPDTTPPTPDPMTWAVAPYAAGSTSISMTATTASDPSGVEYYFACTAGGGNDSGWQDSPTYVDAGLQTGTQYTYQVKARDKSPNKNETASSSLASATPQDVPPAAPTALSATAGDAQVTLDWDDNTETDLAGYNVYRSTSPGGYYTKMDSLLPTSGYLDLAVVNGTTYYYVVTAVDQGNNESSNSNEASATPSSQQTVYVESIMMSLQSAGKNWKAVADVGISPAQAGAAVVGDWYLDGGLIQTAATGTTDSSGHAVITSPPQKAQLGQSFRFVITDVVLSGYVYDPTQSVTEGSIVVQ